VFGLFVLLSVGSANGRLPIVFPREKKEGIMKNTDVDFLKKAAWEQSFKKFRVILGKRFLSLLINMIGLRQLCLLVNTWLLVHGYIRDLVWLLIVVITLFGIVGLKVITHWKDKDHE
jgi:hypothetical protein